MPDTGNVPTYTRVSLYKRLGVSYPLVLVTYGRVSMVDTGIETQGIVTIPYLTPMVDTI